MGLKIVRREEEGIRIVCGDQSIVISVSKITPSRCTLDCTGPRSMIVERIAGDGNDYRSTERSKDTGSR